MQDAYPLNDAVRDYFGSDVSGELWTDIGRLQRQDYLTVMFGIVEYFSKHMDSGGRIIDPYAQREIQYATPGYAAAAALLFDVLGGARMLETAAKALTTSLRELVTKTCPVGTSNFFITMVVFAFEHLREHVSDEQVRFWKSEFAQLHWPHVHLPTINNWHIIALSGEQLRARIGLGPALTATEVDRYLAPHLELLTDYGMYVDPNGPMAYDLFTRKYLKLMLLNGYDGQFKEHLTEFLRRGDLTSLFLQGPTGEMPAGGRSSHHQWNEALQCFHFETAATQYALAGDLRAAGAFRRAAHLSLAAVRRWVRQSGELSIVKNWADPAARTGYEVYSHHSQYNLFTAYLLGVAYVHVDDTIEERACPAETGNHAIWIEPYFHKLFVNVRGNYVQVQTRGEPSYDPTGIVRIQHKGVFAPLGPSNGVPTKHGSGIAFAPAWRNPHRYINDNNPRRFTSERDIVSGGTVRMADLTDFHSVSIDAHVEQRKADKIVVQVEYRGTMGGVFLLKRVLTVTPEAVIVTDEAVGHVDSFTEEIPLLVFDGEHRVDVHFAEKRLDAALGQDRLAVYVLDSAPVQWSKHDPVAFRNGMLSFASYDTVGRTSSYLVYLYRAAEPVTDQRLIELGKE
ncbi:hypothetical protein CEB3_c30520 [Peptococcaceae bacterium CEB3]|nr:hypothetical protein CEB3_c30520 [Peptococcaceae bacterium CEB3]